MNYLDELRRLNLPPDKYAVFGSGVLAIRGLRENRDLDIIVKWDLWWELSKKYESQEDKKLIKLGNIEFATEDWIVPRISVDNLIDNSDIIEGIRYVKLEKMLQWKRIKDREKDREDIKLIEDYLNQNNYHQRNQVNNYK